MEKVKLFILKFLELEAEVTTKKRLPNLDDYNNTLKEYYLFLASGLEGSTGHRFLQELRDEEDYQMFEAYPPNLPRHLYKISLYKSEKYGDVWLVYVSNENPTGNINSLNDIIVVIEQDSRLKVCAFLLYTNYTEYGNRDAPYRWDNLSGYNDLNFKSLKGPIEIQRYRVPSDFQDGLKIYTENI